MKDEFARIESKRFKYRLGVQVLRAPAANGANPPAPAPPRSAGRVGPGRQKAQMRNKVLIAVVAALAVGPLGVIGAGGLNFSEAFGGGREVAAADNGRIQNAKPPDPVDADKPVLDPVNSDGATGVLDRARPGVGPESIERRGRLPHNDVSYVRSMDDILRAIVKFEIPLKADNGMKWGTGFFIDKRGWVATNYHVVKHMTTDFRAKMANGDTYQIAGIIAQSKERDLAIVKIQEKPVQMMLMDVNAYRAEPVRGRQVFSFGHPLDNDFTLTRGIVKRVLAGHELRRAHPGHPLASINSPRNQVWIQHESKITLGHMGGPLFNEECQVMGVDSLADAVTDFRFASHVRHIRDMIDHATDRVTPLEEGRNVVPKGDALQPNLAAEEMKKIFNECKAFSWTPASAGQYAKMARLAGGLATAAGSDDAVATALFGQLRNTKWNGAQIKEANKFAAHQINKVGQGIFVFAKVQQASGNVLLTQIDNTEDFLVVLDVPLHLSGVKRNDKVLMLGLVTKRKGILAMQGAPREGQQQPIYVRVVSSRHMAKVD